MATVYHPPQNDDLELRKHLFQSLDSVLDKFPNAGIVILGDFNKFHPGYLASFFNLTQVVKKPTRGSNILDKIYTTLSTALSKVNWSPFYHTTALENQFSLFSNTISAVIDTHLPQRTIKFQPKDKPWLTADIKNLISKRQKAWSTGNTLKYNFYRNKVRKFCNSARKSFYDKKKSLIPKNQTRRNGGTTSSLFLAHPNRNLFQVFSRR